MAMDQFDFFQVSIPNEFLPVVSDLKVGKSVEDKVRVSLAIGLFAGKQVTLARAAELAGKSLADFIDILRAYQIPWIEYTEKHVMEDEAAIEELFSENEG
ncbi:MAG TPA: hypothetical protein DDY49_01095 [Paenibacillaceae bacterium]|nr:hypothetical protein [Paenibacillaceae bacterium]